MDKNTQPLVLVVDDDASIRSAIRRLLVSAGLAVEVYASGTELMQRTQFDRPGCIILDVHMPGMSGLEVQAALNQRQVEVPVIFLTGTAEVPIAVSAMREGAIDFIEKPFDNDALLARVRQAIDRSRRQLDGESERQDVSRRLESLTQRERSVLELVVAGKTNKEIARELGSSHRTIEIHRRHIMEKMAVGTLADLVRMRLLAQGPSGAHGATGL
ncbi:MAG: response regulator transcription factor [Gammaproteobacteria bacterium]|nr:MAG: response regulator transcription factor [Gammaproteobacteria bacterium]